MLKLKRKQLQPIRKLGAAIKKARVNISPEAENSSAPSNTEVTTITEEAKSNSESEVNNIFTYYYKYNKVLLPTSNYQ